MALRKGTIVTWFDQAEECEDGQCVGSITGFEDDAKRPVVVEWWKLCDLHAAIDPAGRGPYPVDSLWEVGQLR